MKHRYRLHYGLTAALPVWWVSLNGNRITPYCHESRDAVGYVSWEEGAG